MTSDLLIKLERLPAPALLVGADNLIVFANWSAQELLLDIDVTDMPITGFLRDWKNYSAMEINPATMIVEVLLKTGQSMSMPAAFFMTIYRSEPVSGVVLVPSAGSQIWAHWLG